MTADTTPSPQSDSGARHDPEAICTLPPEALEGRLAWIRDDLLPFALEREDLAADVIAWRFAPVAGLDAALDRLVELERACCSAIDFQVEPATVGRGPRLVMRGVDPDAPIFATPLPGAAPEASTLRRGLRALGFGTAASLLVCCVLPLAAGALFGAAVAAPLAGLDQPLVIVLAAVVFGAAGFFWKRRPTKATPADSCGDGC